MAVTLCLARSLRATMSSNRSRTSPRVVVTDPPRRSRLRRAESSRWRKAKVAMRNCSESDLATLNTPYSVQEVLIVCLHD